MIEFSNKHRYIAIGKDGPLEFDSEMSMRTYMIEREWEARFEVAARMNEIENKHDARYRTVLFLSAILCFAVAGLLYFIQN
jgi:hypothetical protein